MLTLHLQKKKTLHGYSLPKILPKKLVKDLQNLKERTVEEEKEKAAEQEEAGGEEPEPSAEEEGGGELDLDF